MRCVVTGATGYIGGRLVPRLLDRGHDVTAMARTPAKLGGAPWREQADVVRGDMSDVESLRAAFDGADVVYYLVHSMGSSTDFATEEQDAARNVVSAARHAGVRRLVYLSGLHPSDTALSTHLRSRTDVGEVLLASGIETVVLQAGVVIGSGSASFEMVRHLTDVLPVMTTPKWVHNTIQPIAIRDVLHYLGEAAVVDVPESRAWDVGGPDVLEYGQMMQIYAEAAGLRRRVIVVLPLLTPTIASWWVGLVTPIPPGLARPLVESLHCDAVMANHDIDTVIPPPASGLTSYRDAVSLALKRIADSSIETSWSGDPDWAGATGYTLTRSAWTPGSSEDLWTAIDTSTATRDWEPRTREPGRLLRLHGTARPPGDWRLEMRVGDVSDRGSRYDQTAIFYPRGIAGRVYWYSAQSLHRTMFRRIFSDVLAHASG